MGRDRRAQLQSRQAGDRALSRTILSEVCNRFQWV
jgi:hypothetical protein